MGMWKTFPKNTAGKLFGCSYLDVTLTYKKVEEMGQETDIPKLLFTYEVSSGHCMERVPS